MAQRTQNSWTRRRTWYINFFYFFISVVAPVSADVLPPPPDLAALGTDCRHQRRLRLDAHVSTLARGVLQPMRCGGGESGVTETIEQVGPARACGSEGAVGAAGECLSCDCSCCDCSADLSVRQRTPEKQGVGGRLPCPCQMSSALTPPPSTVHHHALHVGECITTVGNSRLDHTRKPRGCGGDVRRRRPGRRGSFHVRISPFCCC